MYLTVIRQFLNYYNYSVKRENDKNKYSTHNTTINICY